jgi:proteic killer suppression protein
VIRSFRDKHARALFEGRSVRQYRSFQRQAERRLTMLDAAASLAVLASIPGNRLERLGGDRQGQHSIRINDQWRICFTWTDEGPTEVEIVDYH